jgi:hypothetical protein
MLKKLPPFHLLLVVQHRGHRSHSLLQLLDLNGFARVQNRMCRSGRAVPKEIDPTGRLPAMGFILLRGLHLLAIEEPNRELVIWHVNQIRVIGVAKPDDLEASWLGMAFELNDERLEARLPIDTLSQNSARTEKPFYR